MQAFYIEDPTECLDLTTDGVVLPPSAVPVSGRGSVTAGRFNLELDGDAIGKQIFLHVIDGDAPGGSPSLAVGALAVSSAYQADATAPFRVSPLRVPFVNTRVGESTLETLAYCQMKAAGALQNMVFADVRAAVSSAMAASFTVGNAADVTRIANRIIDYRHAVNGIVAYVDTAGLAQVNKDNFRRLRELAEADVDSCRDGIKPLGSQSPVPCTGNPRLAEYYRAWSLAHRATEVNLDFGRAFNLHLIAWAHDLEKKLGAALAINDPDAVELAKTSRMMRVEAMDSILEDAAQRAGVTTGTIAEARTRLDQLRLEVLLSGAGAGLTFATATDEIFLLLWNDTGLQGDGCAPPPDAMKVNADNAVAAFVSSVADPTHMDIVNFLATQQAGFETDLATCASLANDPLARSGWVDLYLFFTSNDADVR